jgi:hypothetical protein
MPEPEPACVAAQKIHPEKNSFLRFRSQLCTDNLTKKCAESGIRVPEIESSWIRIPNPVPGSKKSLDLGSWSATLVGSLRLRLRNNGIQYKQRKKQNKKFPKEIFHLKPKGIQKIQLGNRNQAKKLKRKSETEYLVFSWACENKAKGDMFSPLFSETDAAFSAILIKIVGKNRECLKILYKKP